MPDYYLGLMSGTSIDSIDAVIAEIDTQHIKVIASRTHPIPLTLKNQIVQLCQPGDNEIERMGAVDYRLGQLFAEAANRLIEETAISHSEIIAIGSHGQTIRHRPELETPFTLQIGNPTIIAQNTNITTIADFRRADMATGGQGAPLVPAFHDAIFTHDLHDRTIVNIGGMANVSILPSDPEEAVTGFDTGPGNILLNTWVEKHKHTPYDENGMWSAAFEYDKNLLNAMLAHSFFVKNPPKSTGREEFNLGWLRKVLDDQERFIEPGVVQSTLCELTTRTIADAIRKYAPKTSEILVCGGGAHNRDLMNRLHQESGLSVQKTDSYGIHVDYVEATAFAWLAYQTINRLPGNLPGVTGASEAVILGAIYPR